jgi:hypothetical protein
MDYPTCRASQVSATSIPPSKSATMAAVRARTAISIDGFTHRKSLNRARNDINERHGEQIDL